jgi:hypothetical protein
MIQIRISNILNIEENHSGNKGKKKLDCFIQKYNKLRNKEARSQSKDLLKWKKKRKYGYRWIAETNFSSLKRMFGEHVNATKFQNMVKEMLIKVSLYNLFRRI